MEKENTIPIAIADDHAIFRNGLTNIVKSWSEFVVVLKAEHGKDLLERLEHAPTFPDICILDMNMPLLNGYETLKEIRKNWPALKILVLSVFIPEFNVVRMINLGANGFLSKGCNPKEIRIALRAIHETGYYYSSFIPEPVFEKAKKSILLKITTREMEFLKLCCSDFGYKDIANKMKISVRTIESYRDSLYEKLQVKSRMGLMIFSVKTGIVPADMLQ